MLYTSRALALIILLDKLVLLPTTIRRVADAGDTRVR
jgi:hypothetical protein